MRNLRVVFLTVIVVAILAVVSGASERGATVIADDAIGAEGTLAGTVVAPARSRTLQGTRPTSSSG